MPPAPTKPGTRKLSEVARHVVVPDGIVSTGYPAVRDKLRDIGIVHDDWQQGLGRLALGKRADRKYAATVGGVVLSIPRQVGKTYLVGTIIIALCLLFPGMKVLWTAHRSRTSDETFLKMKGITARRKVKPFMLDPRSANGQQEIRFRNGSRIMFGARERGFGRGFDEVDVEVFDEAQILSELALEDMVAATNQARHPAGALLFYMGTPPRPLDPGESFAGKRSKALDNKSKDVGAGFGDIVYVEMSADQDADPDDLKQVAKANPSYPVRTPLESIHRLRENVGSVESFLREGLGIWSEDRAYSVIPRAMWRALADCSSEPEPHTGRLVLAIDSDPERTRSTIAVAGLRADGHPLVELTSDDSGAVDNLPGVEWLVERVKTICGRNPDVAAVVVDKRSGASSLIEKLDAAGIPLLTVDAARMADACGQFYDAATETADLRHLDQIELNEALKAALKRPLGDRWAWDRRKPTADITPLTAATLALWGWRSVTTPPSNAGRGRVIALT